MYVLVHHDIQRPEEFWTRSQQALGSLPGHLALHHCLAAEDGTKATCLWEATSADAVRDYLEPLHAGVAANEYRAAENREGVAVPRRYALEAPMP
jgi:hypothetical protein